MVKAMFRMMNGAAISRALRSEVANREMIRDVAS